MISPMTITGVETRASPEGDREGIPSPQPFLKKIYPLKTTRKRRWNAWISGENRSEPQ